MDSDRAYQPDIAVRIHPVGPKALENLHLHCQFLIRPFSLNSFRKFPGIEAGASLSSKINSHYQPGRSTSRGYMPTCGWGGWVNKSAFLAHMINIVTLPCH
jgi:hypothetical protein